MLLSDIVPSMFNEKKRGKGHQTALHQAAVVGKRDAIFALIRGGCALDLQDKVGETALHVAAGLNHKKTVSLLLEAGADAYIKNDAGHTVLDKAQDNNNRDLAILIAKSNQVQKFASGKTVKKKKVVLWTPRIPRDQAPQEKLQISDKNLAEVVEAQAQSGDHLLHNIQPEENKPALSPCTRRKIKRSIEKKDSSFYEEDELPHGKAFQLYTLYRDKDGQIQQAPAKDCYCKPLLRKLVNKLKATEMEMRLQIHTVQEEMNSRLGKVELKNIQQFKVIEKLTEEHVSAERMECHYRINQRATLECMEGEKRQVATTNEVKSWCMSKIQDLEVRTPETRHYKLLRSPSVDDSVVDTESGGLPLLSLISEESSSSLATYVNVLPSPGAVGNSLEFEDCPREETL
ncbi:Ankyrin repeat domain-containing protein 6 [Triplophysa tibetana]|uniref:Ankyrin repeat domain-containing protein 6 n=1 Tax=Triplophysa tibetana TaxID=1572043 RepID=A0A5A9NNE1_9TELE|nr:Ankyrin repeat domain-containing protein 6 [Triplophysa tibetana]